MKYPRKLPLVVLALLCGSFCSLKAQEPVTWDLIKAPDSFGENVLQIAVHWTGSVFLSKYPAATQRSTDKGQSWHDVSTSLGGVSIGCFISRSRLQLYAASDRGIYRSTDDGQSWSAFGVPVQENLGQYEQTINSILFDSKGRMFAAAFQGIFRSIDLGKSWEKVLDRRDADNLIETADGDLFVTVGRIDGWGGQMTQSARILRSTNGGTDWNETALQDDEVVVFRSLALGDNGSLLAGAQAFEGRGAMYRSGDDGRSWGTTSLNDVITAIIPLPGSQWFASAANSGVWQSTNDGRTWSSQMNGMSEPRIMQMAIDEAGHLWCVNVFAFVFRSREPLRQPIEFPTDEPKDDPVNTDVDETYSNENSVLLYPNPARDRLMLRLPVADGDNRRIRIIDQRGVLVRARDNAGAQAGSDGIHFLDLGSMASGNYLVQIETDQGSTVLPFTLRR